MHDIFPSNTLPKAALGAHTKASLHDVSMPDNQTPRTLLSPLYIFFPGVSKLKSVFPPQLHAVGFLRPLRARRSPHRTRVIFSKTKFGSRRFFASQSIAGFLHCFSFTFWGVGGHFFCTSGDQRKCRYLLASSATHKHLGPYG